MTTIPLEAIVKEAQDAFIAAKKDGVLTAGEVIQIALQVSQKLQNHGRDLCGSEKKALLQLTLQKGLKAAGGLPALAGATPEMLASVEAQLLSAAAVAVDATIAAAHGKIAAFRKGVSCFQRLVSLLRPAAAAAAGAPKDIPLLKEALALVGAPSESSNQVSTTPAASQTQTEETVPATPPEKEPSPQASAEESRTPAPVETPAESPSNRTISE